MVLTGLPGLPMGIQSETPSLRSLTDEVRVLQQQHVTMMAQLAALTQYSKDLEKRLDLNGTAIDSLEPAQNAERLTRLEDFVKQHEAESLKTAEWMRLGVGGIIGLLGHSTFKSIVDRRRHRANTAQMNRLETLTNGKMDQLLKISGASQRAEGVLEGKDQQRNNPDPSEK